LANLLFCEYNTTNPDFGYNVYPGDQQAFIEVKTDKTWSLEQQIQIYKERVEFWKNQTLEAQKQFNMLMENYKLQSDIIKNYQNQISNNKRDV